MEIGCVRFVRASRAEVHIYAGEHLIARLKRGRGYRRGQAPYFFNNVALSAPLQADEAARALRAFASRSLGTRIGEAAPLVASFIDSWKQELIIRSPFRDLPDLPLYAALDGDLR